MRELPYRIGPSNIQGKGVIATRFIPAGTAIPMPLPWLDAELFATEDDGVFPGFNHSCNNNLDSRDKGFDSRKALRDIQEGEEITVDYGLSEELRKNCNCEVCREKK